MESAPASKNSAYATPSPAADPPAAHSPPRGRKPRPNRICGNFPSVLPQSRNSSPPRSRRNNGCPSGKGLSEDFSLGFLENPGQKWNMPSRGFLFWFRRTTFFIIEFLLFATVSLLHSAPFLSTWVGYFTQIACVYAIYGMVIWCIFFLRSEPLLATVGLASLPLVAVALAIRFPAQY